MGRSAETLATLPRKLFGEEVKAFGAGLARVIPNLQVYVPSRDLLTGEAPGTNLYTYIAAATLQSALWCTALLVIAGLIFRRRDFL